MKLRIKIQNTGLFLIGLLLPAILMVACAAQPGKAPYPYPGFTETPAETPAKTPVIEISVIDDKPWVIPYTSYKEIIQAADIIVTGKVVDTGQIYNMARVYENPRTPDPNKYFLGRAYEVHVESYLKGQGPKNFYIMNDEKHAYGISPEDLQERVEKGNFQTSYFSLDPVLTYLLFLKTGDNRFYHPDISSGVFFERLYLGTFYITSQDKVMPVGWDSDAFRLPLSEVIAYIQNPAEIPPISSDSYPGPETPPTFTPFPSPTLPPDPTGTPFPLATAASDASGVIRYLQLGEASAAALGSLPVDALGMAQEAPEQQPLSTAIPPDRVFYPSPDGKSLAILQDTEGGFVGQLLDTTSGEIHAFFETIAMGIFYGWHPDSQQILIRSHGENLWLANPLTGNYTTVVMPDYGSIYGGSVSPDGNQVIYSYDRGFDPEGLKVRIVNSDGRNDRLLLDEGGVYFAWSPDGSQIAFQSSSLMVMNADGSGLLELSAISLPGCDTNPIFWSPDSRKLAVVTSLNGYETCLGRNDTILENFDIYIVDVESGEAHPLLSDGINGNFDPAWSPDGSQIAFVSTRGGSQELWAVNLDGSGLRQLTQDGGPVRAPFWRIR